MYLIYSQKHDLTKFFGDARHYIGVHQKTPHGAIYEMDDRAVYDCILEDEDVADDVVGLSD